MCSGNNLSTAESICGLQKNTFVGGPACKNNTADGCYVEKLSNHKNNSAVTCPILLKFGE